MDIDIDVPIPMGLQPPSNTMNASPSDPSINRSVSMYSQLETMMAAVRKEAAALDAMKQKIKEMDEIKKKVPELKQRLQETELKNNQLAASLKLSEDQTYQLRNDLQQLNDIYNTERKDHENIRQNNAFLDQELARVTKDMQFMQRDVQKLGELKKKNQLIITQLNDTQILLEEERAEAQKNLSQLEKKITVLENEKASTSNLFWSVTGQLKSTKEEFEKQKLHTAELEKKVEEVKIQSNQSEDRNLMVLEDTVARSQRISASSSLSEKEIYTLKQEIDNLNAVISAKEDSYTVLGSKLKALEAARQNEKNEIKAKMIEMNQSIVSLRNLNHELEGEASDARHRLGLIEGDLNRYTAEVQQLQHELQRSEGLRIQKENEYSKEMKTLVTARDEAVQKMNNATTQYEIMQVQLREAQARHWDELQRAKEAEAQLSEETERITQELQEKTLKLIAIEAERAKYEDNLRNEVGSASHMAVALRTELEKRLDELTQARRERDTYRNERDEAVNRANEFAETIKKNDITFKKIIEQDRLKIQNEVRSKMGRLKTLESEKQELLQETNNLMAQVSENQRELNKMRHEVEESKKVAIDLTNQVQAAKLQNQELMIELKGSSKKEQELREQATKIEHQFREDVFRLESIVKDSKKAAASQVLEISNRAKQAMDEVEHLKRQQVDYIENEKRANEIAEKLRLEIEISKKNQDDFKDHMGRDVIVLKRDLQEHKQKLQISNEVKTKMEVELMQSKVELTRAENEMGRMQEWVKEQEQRLQSSTETIKQHKNDAQEAIKEARSAKHKVHELEENYNKVKVQLDNANKATNKIEREAIAETKRIKLQLAQAEAEINELKPIIPMLQKELAEGKANFAKLQSSTNSTVNGLLEELRATEDALSKERKKSQNDIEAHHSKIMELHTNLEKAKEHIEETQSHSKNDRKEKEMKIIQMEKEMERVKSILSTKELRVEELEKQHQADRMRLHELKEQLDNSERSIIDTKTNFELEQAQRRRLEARLKAAIDASRKDIEAGVMSPVKTGHVATIATSSVSSSSPSQSNHILTAQRNSILYGQDLDESTSIYDESILAYDDDNVLMDSTRGSPINTKSNASISFNTNDVQPSPPNKGISAVNQSPVDRVSAALAARAAAESSKAALKQAQQMRNMGRQQQIEQTDINTNNNTNSGQMNLFRRPSKGKIQDVRDLKSQTIDDNDNMNEYDNDDDDIGYVPPQNNDDNHNQVNVEESISKTEMFLRQRLSKVAGGGDSNNNTNYNNAAQVATEMAQAAYNRQQQQQGNGPKEGGAVYLYNERENVPPKFAYGKAGGNTNDEVNLNAPKLRPASPPNKNITLIDDDDDDDDYDDYDDDNQNKQLYASTRQITLGGDPPMASAYKEPISVANSKAIQRAMDASVGIQLPKISSASKLNDTDTNTNKHYTVSVKKKK